MTTRLAFLISILVSHIAAAEAFCPTTRNQEVFVSGLLTIPVREYARVNRLGDTPTEAFVEASRRRFEREYAKQRSYQGEPGSFSLTGLHSDVIVGEDKSPRASGIWYGPRPQVTEIIETMEVQFHPSYTIEQVREMKCAVIDRCLAIAKGGENVPEYQAIKKQVLNCDGAISH